MAVQMVSRYDSWLLMLVISAFAVAQLYLFVAQNDFFHSQKIINHKIISYYSDFDSWTLNTCLLSSEDHTNNP